MSNMTKNMFHGWRQQAEMIHLQKHPKPRLELRDVQDNDPRIPPGTPLPVKQKEMARSPVIVRQGITGFRASSKRVCKRVGKTAKDHKSGSHASRFANRDARVAWQQDHRATNDTFPGRRSA
jgi:hypothetical protein